MSYLDKVTAFQSMMKEEGSMEAFEKYYAEECVITEMPTGEKRIGKDAQREAMKQWFSSVKEFHGAGATSITANEADGTTMVECWFDITHKEAGRMKMQEVAVQKWKGDQIIDEKFYYNSNS